MPPRLRRLNQSSDISPVGSNSKSSLTPEDRSPTAKPFTTCVQQFPPLGSYNQEVPTYGAPVAAKPHAYNNNNLVAYPPTMTDQLPYYQGVPQPLQSGVMYPGAQPDYLNGQIYNSNNNKFSPVIQYAAPYMPPVY